MATLFTDVVDTNNEYADLETVTSLTLTSGNAYTLQFLGSYGYVREGDDVEGSHYLAPSQIFQIQKGDDNWYIRVPRECGLVVSG